MIISNTLIYFFTKSIKSSFTVEELEQITYSMQRVFWELEKSMYLCLIFAYENKFKLFILTFFVLISIRINTDGYHVESSLLCLFLSYLMFYLSINILPIYFPLTINIGIPIMILTVIPTILFAPVDIEINAHTVRKSFATATTFFWYIVILINWQRSFAESLLWIIVVQNIQLVIVTIKRKQVRL